MIGVQCLGLGQCGRNFDETDFHRQVVQRSEQEQAVDQKDSGVQGVQTARLGQVTLSPEHCTNSDGQHNQKEDSENDATCACKFRSHR